MLLNDAELSSLVRSAIEDRYGYDEVIKSGDVPHLFRVIHYVEGCDGFAQVNGFNSLMCMYCDHRFLADAFREVGLEWHARVVTESIALFPESDRLRGYAYPFGDWREYEDYVRDKPQIQPQVDQLASNYLAFGCCDVERALSTHIRIHRRLIEPLAEHITKHREYQSVLDRAG